MQFYIKLCHMPFMLKFTDNSPKCSVPSLPIAAAEQISRWNSSSRPEGTRRYVAWAVMYYKAGHQQEIDQIVVVPQSLMISTLIEVAAI